jgi:hypothetical protein
MGRMILSWWFIPTMHLKHEFNLQILYFIMNKLILLLLSLVAFFKMKLTCLAKPALYA